MAETENTIENIIANYFVIITRCDEFGTDYNPVRDEIKIAKMTTQYNDVMVLQNDYKESQQATTVLVNTREQLFTEMRAIAVRSINEFESTKASVSVKKDARRLLNKITGKYKKIKKLDNGLPDPKYVSQSQQGYVNKVENFETLVTLYTKDGNYDSNETILKLTSLNTIVTNLIAANKSVELSNSETIKKRILRNYGLFEEEKGVIDISLACKKYVRGLYGPKSEEAKKITSVKLRRVMRLKKAQETL